MGERTPTARLTALLKQAAEGEGVHEELITLVREYVKDAKQ